MDGLFTECYKITNIGYQGLYPIKSNQRINYLINCEPIWLPSLTKVINIIKN
jgi:hypothetical protein